MPRRSPKPKNVIWSQFCCLKVSKWESELGNQENPGPKVSGRLSKPQNVVCNQIWYLKVSKWESELGNQENLGPKVSGSLWEGLWSTLDPFLDRPSPPNDDDDDVSGPQASAGEPARLCMAALTSQGRSWHPSCLYELWKRQWRASSRQRPRGSNSGLPA